MNLTLSSQLKDYGIDSHTIRCLFLRALISKNRQIKKASTSFSLVAVALIKTPHKSSEGK